MSAPLEELSIHGFKSIQRLDGFELEKLNVFIGANGAGKSNLVDFFRLLESMVVGNLSGYALLRGADSLFFEGPKTTPEIRAELLFGMNGYAFALQPSADEGLIVTDERSAINSDWKQYQGARVEARLAGWSGSWGKDMATGCTNVRGHIHRAISSWRVYHFHDTGQTAPLRRSGQAQDVGSLRNDGSNIGPFLLDLRENHPLSYGRIVDTVRMIAPYFDTFSLDRRSRGGVEEVRLQWRQKGSDFPFTAAHLSDGTIRFIALATALLQPAPPSTIVIDEPELGLHPYALSLLTSLLNEASERMQVIVATQSPALVDDLEPEDVVVVGRREGQTVFDRLERASLESWLDEYSLGELWQKNVINAGPDNA